jgi:hypothetical protein
MSDPDLAPSPKTLSRKQRQTVKTRQRAAQKRARQAEIDRITDTKAEALAEDQAPAAQRTNGNAVLDLKRGGYRRADPLMALRQGRKLTRVHISAARRFSEDFEVGVLGACCHEGSMEVVDGGGGGSEASDSRLDAIARYRAACDDLGPQLRSVVQWVALHRWPVSRVALFFGVDDDDATVMVVAGLNRLVLHYHPEGAALAEVIERLIVDSSVIDISQDRLGRVVRAMRISYRKST